MKSLYQHLTFGGVIDSRLKKLWSSTIPLKVKIFLWQTYHNRIQTADQLSVRNWKGDVNCILCGVVEDARHVLFQCVLAKFAWACCMEAFDWRRGPDSLDDLHHC